MDAERRAGMTGEYSRLPECMEAMARRLPEPQKTKCNLCAQTTRLMILSSDFEKIEDQQWQRRAAHYLESVNSAITEFLSSIPM